MQGTKVSVFPHVSRTALFFEEVGVKLHPVSSGHFHDYSRIKQPKQAKEHG